MIPDNITKDHIILAIKEIDDIGYPEVNEPTKYYLKYENKNIHQNMLWLLQISMQMVSSYN